MTKMRKIYVTIVTMVLIIIMVALPMTLRNVAALGPVGCSYSLTSFTNNNSDYPYYGECEHSHLNHNDDMMVGLGVYAYYDLNDQTPAYNLADWWFSAQAGNSTSTTNNSPVQISPPLTETTCLDYSLSTQTYNNYYDYSSGTWTNGYYYNGQWTLIGYYCSVDSDQMNQWPSDRTSIEGMTACNFYYNSAPGTLDYYQCHTQLPPLQSMPQNIPSFAYLTAHQTGDW
jgi:hypothetical protein